MENNKIAFASFCAISIVCTVLAEPSITNVTAQQRYPWNGKVDISYTVTDDMAAMANEQGLIPSLIVTASDSTAGTNYVATTLSGDTGLVSGTHSVVWDMAADGLDFISSNVVFTVACEMTPATYCVIDLSAGASALSYPVSYLAEPPSGGFNANVYKTTELALRRIEPGTFMMQDKYQTTLTKAFYIGIFEMTQNNTRSLWVIIPHRTISDQLQV